ncbi:6-hydroxymethylpterin diphosphokinase MptE-like protein [Paenibacillus sp. OV219]|uniref:motility associated factor glycosyltransferase family protein n=1 Tax=Paenibacillus sp. OV219 TaxID=1884377 RepID=UPI0008BF3DB1|nr:6-hydroxymethylpterin diphosphokinase MptE-like protein [Paenibacillus sp. OV219]SEN65082.1 Uncharacterized conserved protein [Paenibacillus sp. OV219]
MSGQAVQTTETIEEVKLFLPRLIQACDSISELFYVAITDETWQLFGELVQGMDDLYRTLKSVVSTASIDEQKSVMLAIMERTIVTFENTFAELNSYMDQELYVAAGDCIRYELSNLFKELATHLGEETSLKEERFATNMRFLEREYANLYTQLKNIEIDEQNYESVYATNGAPNLIVHRDTADSVYLYSTYDPFFEAERWVESLVDTVSGKSNIVMYGFAFGYHVNRLAEIYPEQMLYIYEPNEQIFLKMMHEISLEKICTRLNIQDIVVGTGKAMRDQFFYRMLKKIKGETAIVSLSVYDRMDLQAKKEFAEDAKAAILTYASSRSIYNRFGIQWTRNQLFNTAFNITTPSLKGLKGKFEHLPAVIVGAGPSLEHDIENLMQIKQRALIIAAGSSIQSLTHYGIEPHLIVSMDGGSGNYHAFKSVETSHIPFLYIPQIDYRVVDKQATNLIHAYFNNDIISRYVMGVSGIEDPVFDSNLSVTGTAVQAALYLGCKEIIFTGQDLSYPDDCVYATGAQHASDNYKLKVLKAATLTVENVNGTRNRTTNGLKQTLIDIEETIEKYPSVRFINTSKLGAKIKHTESLPMEEVCLRLKDWNLAPDVFKEAIQVHLSRYEDSRILESMDKVSKLQNELNQVDEKVKRIQRTLNKLPELSRTKPLKCLNAMVDIEDDWAVITQTVAFNTIYMTAVKNEILEFDRKRSELADENNVMIKSELFGDVLGTLVNAIKEQSPTLKEIMDEVQERIRVSRSRSLSEQLV